MISNLITIFRTAVGIYAVMTYQGGTKKLLCIHDAWNFCMAAMHGDTCIKLLAFVVNSISLKTKTKKTAK